MRSATEHAEAILAMVGPLNRAIQAAEDDGLRVKLDGELSILMGKVGTVVVSAETKAKVTAPEDGRPWIHPPASVSMATVELLQSTSDGGQTPA